jgi:hypothetical protein
MKTTTKLRSSPMRHAVMVLVAVSYLSVFACAQTAEELVSKNLQAKGGIDKIKSVNTLRMTGKLKNAGGRMLIFGQTNMRPDFVRQTRTVQGMTAIQAYNGSTGWRTQPFRGRKEPELMGEDILRDLLLASDFDGPLVDYAAKGNTIEYLGHDLIDGDDALRMRVTLKNGDIIYYYLDPDTYLEIRKEIQQFVRGSMRERVVDVGSYKPVDGVMYPFSISEGPRDNPGAQVTTIEKIEVNLAVPDSDFSLPASLKQAQKPDSEKN